MPLDRVPTRNERWIGLTLSALLALVFLPLAVFVYTKISSTETDPVRLTILAVLTLIGVAGAILFYRIAFTRPQAASARAGFIFARIAVASGIVLIVLPLIHPTDP